MPARPLPSGSMSKPPPRARPTQPVAPPCRMTTRSSTPRSSTTSSRGRNSLHDSPDTPQSEASASERPMNTAAAEADANVPDVAEAEAEVQEDLDELSVLAKERDEYLDALRRLQADFENYKKRMIKQQTENLERAHEGLVEQLLPVLDTMDLA